MVEGCSFSLPFVMVGWFGFLCNCVVSVEICGYVISSFSTVADKKSEKLKAFSAEF